MIRTRFSCFLSLAMAGCLLIAATAYTACVAPIVFAARAVKDWALDGFKLATKDEGFGLGRPQVPFVQARAFVLRLAKRERPQLSGSWRMCPST